MDVRPVPFADGYYVSDRGAVFSEKWGRRLQLKPWRSNRLGHLRVSLQVGHAVVRVYLHRLVALVFIGSPDSPELEVRHLDGNPHNCTVGNLAWGTHGQNMQDMVRHGTQGARRHPNRVPRGTRHGRCTRPESTPRGERAGAAKIGEEEVRRLRAEYKETGNISEAARRVGIPRGAAKCVIQGKTWKHVA